MSCWVTESQLSAAGESDSMGDVYLLGLQLKRACGRVSLQWTVDNAELNGCSGPVHQGMARLQDSLPHSTHLQVGR